jgi:phage baseplate assembly protein W
MLYMWSRGTQSIRMSERKNAVERHEARIQVTQADETTIVGGNVEVLQQEQGENI